MQIRQLDSRRGPPLPTAGAGTMTAIVQDALRLRARGSAPARGDRPAHHRRRRGPGAGARGQRRPGHLARHGRPALSHPRSPASVCAGRSTPTRAGAWPARSRPSAPDVTGFAAGRRGVRHRPRSSFAEYAAARPGKLARKPANLSFEQAAAVPISGVTALQAVRDHGRVQAGQKVLIIGASGGVGTFAVQIAKAFGAEVTGVCSTAKVDMVRALGADHVIDYTREDFADGGPPLRRHPRHRRQRPAVPSPACAHPAGTARHRRRRDRRTAARRHRPPDPGPAAVPVRRPEAGHVRGVGERRRPGRPPRAHRGRQGRPADRPDLPARRGRRRPSATCWTDRPAASSSSPSPPAARRAQTRGAPRDREPNPVPRPRRRVAGPVGLPLAVAGQVAAADPALRRAGLPVAGLRRRHRRRVLRDPGHRPLPAGAVRLQRRRAALDLAGALLRLRRPRHRPLPAVHPRPTCRTTRPTSTCAYPERLSRGLVLVKWWLLAIPHYLVARRLRRRRALARHPRRDATAAGTAAGPPAG